MDVLSGSLLYNFIPVRAKLPVFCLWCPISPVFVLEGRQGQSRVVRDTWAVHYDVSMIFLSLFHFFLSDHIASVLVVAVLNDLLYFFGTDRFSLDLCRVFRQFYYTLITTYHVNFDLFVFWGLRHACGSC